MPDEVWTTDQYRAYLAGQSPAPLRVLTLDADAPEDALRQRVQQLCKATGYLYYHALKSQGSTPGWPDTAIVHPDGGPLYLWELKRQDAHESPAQRRWLNALARVTRVETGVYRPSDWPLLTEILTHKEAL